MSTQSPTELDLIRADQVGSLLRPAALKEVFARRADGQASDEELQRAEDEAIRQVIAQQESVGMQVVSDGEFRRIGFQESFGESVAGFARARSRFEYYAESDTPSASSVRLLQRNDLDKTKDGPPIQQRRPVIERLKLVRNVPLEEYRAAAAMTSLPVKVTLIGPDRISQRFDWEKSRDFYDGLDEFVADVVSIERQMIAELVEAGCKYIQIDAPGYTAYVDPPSLEQMRSRGEDPARNLARSIEADNAIIEGFPGVTFGIHICRGNGRSMWHREGYYDAIAEQLFAGLKHQRLLLEYDSERAGGFEPLRFVPKNKVVVLGLITTKLPEVETVDALVRRIEEASGYLPMEQLALSPQCGFASGIEGNLLEESDQWRKFGVMVETTRRIWG
jgi:5-methyltetrahydropteroyltriglutamate--homocysteine methyltransferase